jgi:hypothetical protein
VTRAEWHVYGTGDLNHSNADILCRNERSEADEPDKPAQGAATAPVTPLGGGGWAFGMQPLRSDRTT